MSPEKFVPKKLKKDAIKHKLPDEIGRMAFGEYEFERFERVPKQYLIWVKYNVSDLDRYPNLKKYIEEEVNEEDFE